MVNESKYTNCIRKTLIKQHAATITQRSILVRKWLRCANEFNHGWVSYVRRLNEPSFALRDRTERPGID